MPFATYTINEKLLKYSNNINHENLEKFNYDIADLNRNQKAIFIKKKNDDIKISITEKIKELSNSNLDLNSQKTKDLLTKLYYEIDKSILCELPENEIKKIKLDFEKDHENPMDHDVKDKILQGDFYPEDFEKKVDKFVKEFLNKITIFALAKFQKKKDEQIDKIYIYHKELSKYLFPNEKSIKHEKLQNFKNSLKKDFTKTPKQQKEDGRNLSSMKKIEYGLKVLLRWWLTIPDYIRPKFKILSDVPPSLFKYAQQIGFQISSNEIRSLEKKILDFFALENSNTKIKVELIAQKNMPGWLWWQHKRHWIFSPKIKKSSEEKIENFDFLAIKHDYGVEFVDTYNNFELRKDMELKIITNKKIKQMQDIKDHLIIDAKKNQI